eukprot:2871296-Heterocapsa_arctica.AAC.1
MRSFSTLPRWASLMRRSALDMIRLTAANALAFPFGFGRSNASVIAASQLSRVPSGRPSRIASNCLLQVSRILPCVAGEWAGALWWMVLEPAAAVGGLVRGRASVLGGARAGEGLRGGERDWGGAAPAGWLLRGLARPCSRAARALSVATFLVGTALQGALPMGGWLPVGRQCAWLPPCWVSLSSSSLCAGGCLEPVRSGLPASLEFPP